MRQGLAASCIEPDKAIGDVWKIDAKAKTSCSAF
jgi:hypothetical protein